MVSLARRGPLTQELPSQLPIPEGGPLDAVVRDLLMQSDPARGTVVGITSAIRGEGKSGVARELATSLSRRTRGDRPVLLVDCSPKAVGGAVTRARSGARLQERDLQTLVRAGSLSESLEGLRERHSAVLLDLPPLLGSVNGAHLASSIDRLFLVVRAGATRADQVERAIESIGRDRIDGVILTDVAPVRRGWLTRLVS